LNAHPYRAAGGSAIRVAILVVNPIDPLGRFIAEVAWTIGEFGECRSHIYPPRESVD
jgi:hypothetical protein